MDAAQALGTNQIRLDVATVEISPRMVSAAEFRQLLVSHRKLVRADRRGDRLRGLQDVQTGEVFVTDEHRLLEAPRPVHS